MKRTTKVKLSSTLAFLTFIFAGLALFDELQYTVLLRSVSGRDISPADQLRLSLQENPSMYIFFLSALVFVGSIIWLIKLLFSREKTMSQ